jgi:hypothetical protein
MPPRKRTTTAKTPPRRRPIPWKRAGLVLLGILLVVGFLFSTGVLQELTAGPKRPLPRVNLGLGFGTDIKDVKAKFPGCQVRDFNEDPQFRIITLKEGPDIPEGAKEAEMIFFEGKLYFVSAQWEGEPAEKMPFDSWIRDFRRWKLKQDVPPIPLQGADKDTSLKEWFFQDDQTEMILRDLHFKDQVNRWKDLRDASNEEAHSAFAKYRFDLQ